MAVIDTLVKAASSLSPGSTSVTKKTTSTATSGGTSTGYKPYVAGENAELDSKLSGYSDAYAAARAAGDAAGMREANDKANQLRNQYGYAAQSANEDINKIAKASGTSSGTASYSARRSMGPSGSGFQVTAPEVQKAEDYSEYIKSLQEAATEKALAELKSAYDANVNAIDKAKGEIAPQYEAARNQTAGQAALQRKNWQETAATLGLNSGAAGQAELARQNALQGSLTDLARQESADLAQLEAQRAQTETDYNNAIAQAKASGDYQLAQRLYEEKVRVDEANRQAIAQQWQQQLQALQFNYGVSQDALTQSNWERQYADQQKQYADQKAQQAWENQMTENQAAADLENTQFSRMWNLAAAQADYGDFSGFSALGLSDAAIANMKAVWQQDRDLALKQAELALQQDQLSLQKAQNSLNSGGSGYRSGSVGNSGNSAGGVDWSPVQAWVDKYGAEAAENYIKEHYKALGFSSQTTALAGWQNHLLEAGGVSTGTGSGSNGYDPFWSSMLALGIGPVSASYVAEIADAGGIIENPDESVQWAPGWNASNYRQKMEETKNKSSIIRLNGQS